MKTYIVSWEETHSVRVKATDELEAKDKAQNGDIVGNESAELSGDMEVSKTN